MDAKKRVDDTYLPSYNTKLFKHGSAYGIEGFRICPTCETCENKVAP